MSETRSSFEALLREGNVALFDCAPQDVPDVVRGKRSGRVRRFSRAQGAAQRYERIAQIREEHADVYFLDRKATKALFADFPATARFLCIRLLPRGAWLLALPGLVRRLLIGLVSVRGVIMLPAGGTGRLWLLLEHHMRESHNPRLCLSEEVGVQGFIDFLNRERVNYVVLRFYEKLPALGREGGDLDILVSDEDEETLRAFLHAHPGPIGVDVWSVSRTSHGAITYYPPPLARKVLQSAVEGPASARIPAPREGFLSLAYHVLYHKGTFAGVPSTLPGIKVNTHPENDYAGALARAAKRAGVDIEISMEALDDYLAGEGWRPKLDTLAKIASRNLWVRERFFGAPMQETGLGIFIIKRKAVELGVAEAIERRVEEDGRFRILRKRVFTPQEVPRIAEELRGGVWNERGGRLEDFLPAVALAVVDTHLARSSELGLGHTGPGEGIKMLKGRLRGEFRIQGGNLLHSTDTTHEAREYMEVCFPGEHDSILADAKKAGATSLSGLESLLARARLLPRRAYFALTRFRRSVAKRLLALLLR